MGKSNLFLDVNIKYLRIHVLFTFYSRFIHVLFTFFFVFFFFCLTFFILITIAISFSFIVLFYNSVKVSGIAFGISINLVGSLTLEEVPYDGEMDEKDLELLNSENFNLNDTDNDILLTSEAEFRRVEDDNRPKQVKGECPGRRPFSLWTAFSEKLYHGLSRDAAIKKRIQEAKAKVKKSDGYKAYEHFEANVENNPDKGRYPLADVEMGSTEIERKKDRNIDRKAFKVFHTKGKREPKVFGEVGVAQSMRAMVGYGAAIKYKMVKYSAHVMNSLMDYQLKEPITGAERHKYEFSSGRYLARHVTGGGMAEAATTPCYKIMRKDECESGASGAACTWSRKTKGKTKFEQIKSKTIGHCAYKTEALEKAHKPEKGRMTPIIESDIKTQDSENDESETKPESEQKSGSGEGQSDIKADKPKKVGERGAGVLFDDRVINIPRVMRRSFHNESKSYILVFSFFYL